MGCFVKEIVKLPECQDIMLDIVGSVVGKYSNRRSELLTAMSTVVIAIAQTEGVEKDSLFTNLLKIYDMMERANCE